MIPKVIDIDPFDGRKLSAGKVRPEGRYGVSPKGCNAVSRAIFCHLRLDLPGPWTSVRPAYGTGIRAPIAPCKNPGSLRSNESISTFFGMKLLIVISALLLLPQAAVAQEFNLSDLIPNSSGTYTGRIVQGLLLLSILSVAPGLLVTMTSFTRFIIAFSFLRSGLGLQSTPSNLIVISLALFMTYFVMSPVFEKSWNEGVQPLIENKISEEVAFEKITAPLRTFMLDHVRDKDLQLFASFSDEAEISGTEQAEPSLRLILPAFLLSELRRGFEIGFLILLPFLVIDLVVSVITMSMGMMMLPPTVVALPFKVLFFVLMDGWNLIVGELLKSML